ncbi:putative 30 kDa protein [Murine adenovirus 1]|uniref:Putative 30 kDa protein n=1 Tax=Murine adenovirus A serotype 1 TaxID=10530 RepID=O10441_ADEM1|nr:putative 30 kDa protein [Murine mastadenovirus A]AAB53756.1 putative 30 kDa protein [Murine adenovirus 1]
MNSWFHLYGGVITYNRYCLCHPSSSFYYFCRRSIRCCSARTRGSTSTAATPRRTNPSRRWSSYLNTWVVAHPYGRNCTRGRDCRWPSCLNTRMVSHSYWKDHVYCVNSHCSARHPPASASYNLTSCGCHSCHGISCRRQRRKNRNRNFLVLNFWSFYQYLHSWFFIHLYVFSFYTSMAQTRHRNLWSDRDIGRSCIGAIQVHAGVFHVVERINLKIASSRLSTTTTHRGLSTSPCVNPPPAPVKSTHTWVKTNSAGQSHSGC